MDTKLTYYDITSGVFEISGLPWLKHNKSFCRLNVDWLPKFNENIQRLSWCTAGAAVRFSSNSPVIAVKVELTSKDDMSHMPRSAISGVDLYIGKGKNKKFVKVAMPENNQTKYEAVFKGFKPKMQEWTINLPLYNGVKKLEVGLSSESQLAKPAPYSIEKPIVFYGSSITQGACASRPGNAYNHIVCRWLDAPLVNLGFSGKPKASPKWLN